MRFALITIVIILFSLFSGCTENLKPPEERLLSGTPEEQKCLKYFEDKAKDASKGNIEWDALCLKYESRATSVDKPLSGAPTPTNTAAPASVATAKVTPAGDLPSAIMADATLDAGVIYAEIFNADANPKSYSPDELLRQILIGKNDEGDMYFKLKLLKDVDLEDTYFSFGPLVFNALPYVVHISENDAYLMELDGFPDHPVITQGHQPMHVDTKHPLELYNGGDKVVLKAGGLFKELMDFKELAGDSYPFDRATQIRVTGPQIPIGDVLKQLQ